MALACAALLAALAAQAVAQKAHTPRSLLIRVRDTPPNETPNFLRERNGSYTVSTGQGGDRDERVAAAGNATVVSTSASVRLVHAREGEPVRVDLPSVQTLQFHAPLGKSAPPAHAGGGATAARAGAAQAPTGASASAGASGVVFFEAVSAFAARFALEGSSVRIELVPLQAPGIAAPFAAAAGGEPPRTVTLLGRVGQWIALGDTDLGATGKSLSITPEPPSQPTVWVRVDPDPAERP